MLDFVKCFHFVFLGMGGKFEGFGWKNSKVSSSSIGLGYSKLIKSEKFIYGLVSWLKPEFFISFSEYSNSAALILLV